MSAASTSAIENICVVFLCNKAYFNKFVHTCSQLVSTGKYKGDICLVIGNDLLGDELLNCKLIKDNNILIKHFPDIEFSNSFLDIQAKLNRPSHWFKKLFQYHKLHLFNVFFKRWDYIFYLDCGITILSDISPMLAGATPNILLAHSDAYPTYKWKLYNQFDPSQTEHFRALFTKHKLNIDYFQTTIMLYDTNIIDDSTYTDLLNLLLEYPISITNDQGIISLYFTNIRPFFKQIQTSNDDTYFYDYLARSEHYKYIMLKV